MSRTIFVTGGAGYVGSHCCQAFAEAGWNVVVYDNLSRGWRDFVRWGPLVEGDLRDEARLARALSETKPDAVAHFAALAYVAESLLEPERYYRVNLCGTLNLLEAMRRAEVGRLVFSSTCATYGAPGLAPVDESHSQAPISPYGWSKLAAERTIRDFGAAHGLRFVTLRYFNAAGADPAGVIGERHRPEPHVIPLAIRGAMTSDYTFTIHGTDYETRDGTALRDFVHVADLADAHRLALEHLFRGGSSEVFNLGTGVGTTVAEVAAAVERVAGRRILRAFGPRRPGDAPVAVASNAKARSLLGWRPRRSDIETIIKDAWLWHEKER